MTSSLHDSYERCQRLHRRHGRSYYLATRLLPRWQRRHVHALYGFSRYTDDIVDETGSSSGASEASRRERLAAWERRFREGLAGDAASDDPILPAVLHTIAAFDLDHRDFTAFLRSMAMDLEVTSYPDYDALLDYMDGSAAAIGTMTLPILVARDGRTPPCPRHRERLREPARQLGLAFQLTNFIRDVAEDFGRGRVYLPEEDLRRFGVARDDLGRPKASPALRALIAFEIERARGHYRAAAEGTAALPGAARRCMRLATAVYGGILTEVERAGGDVLAGRAVVPRRRRLLALVKEAGRP